jgi:hypothetical protein
MRQHDFEENDPITGIIVFNIHSGISKTGRKALFLY